MIAIKGVLWYFVINTSSLKLYFTANPLYKSLVYTILQK